MEDNTDAANATDESKNTGTEGEKQGEQNKTTEGGDKQAADRSDSNGDGKNNQQQQKADDKGKENKEQPLAAGDLKLQDGTIVKAGAERRYYEQYNIERQRSADLNNQLKQMTGSRDRFRDEVNTLRSTAQSLQGAEPEVTALGIKIVGDLQRDPLGTVRKLVAECVAAGHTIEGIQAGLSAEVMAMIQQRVTPTQQQGPTEEEINNAALAEVNEFYGSFPDARVHDALLARVLADHPTLDMRTAYFELKKSFAEKGFDWSKPLEVNLQSQQRQQPNPQQQQKPMPNGRAPVEMNLADKTVVAQANADTSDIIKEAMREAGLNI